MTTTTKLAADAVAVLNRLEVALCLFLLRWQRVSSTFLCRHSNADTSDHAILWQSRLFYQQEQLELVDFFVWMRQKEVWVGVEVQEI